MVFGALLAATVLFADTTPAAADAAAKAAAPAPAAAATAEAKPKPRVICKSEQVTGSLMAKKTCYTEDQAAQRKQDERQNLEKMQSQMAIKGN